MSDRITYFVEVGNNDETHAFQLSPSVPVGDSSFVSALQGTMDSVIESANQAGNIEGHQDMDFIRWWAQNDKGEKTIESDVATITV